MSDTKLKQVRFAAEVTNDSSEDICNKFKSEVATNKNKTTKKDLVRDSEIALHKYSNRDCGLCNFSRNKTRKEKESKPNEISFFNEPEISYTKRFEALLQSFPKSSVSIFDHYQKEQALSEKAASRLNVPPVEIMYKDLIPLSVCDEELFGESVLEKAKDSETQPKFRDREPKLDEYFIPTFNQEHLIPVHHPADIKRKIRSVNDPTVRKQMERLGLN